MTSYKAYLVTILYYSQKLQQQELLQLWSMVIFSSQEAQQQMCSASSMIIVLLSCNYYPQSMTYSVKNFLKQVSIYQKMYFFYTLMKNLHVTTKKSSNEQKYCEIYTTRRFVPNDFQHISKGQIMSECIQEIIDFPKYHIRRFYRLGTFDLF